MLLIAAALLGLAGGLLTGGSVRNLLARRLRWPVAVIAAFLVRELLIRTPFGGLAVAPAVFVLSLAVLVAWTAWHRDELPGILLVTIGVGMNLVVVALNGGRMPVDLAAANRGPAQLGRTGVWAQYTLMGPGTVAGWLADRILLPGPLSRLFPEAYSAGDLVSAAGLAVTLFLATRSRAPQPRQDAITSR